MFYSTQQAVSFGLDCDFFQRERLAGLREIYKAQCDLAIDKGRFDLASWMATQAQFCREALDAGSLESKVFSLKPHQIKIIMDAVR